MASDDFNNLDTPNPLDTAEIIATSNEWNYDRHNPDQMSITIMGQWRTYNVSMVLDNNRNLRLFCTFELEPLEDSLPKLYETINLANDRLWGENFVYWNENKLMTVRKMHFITNDEILSDDFLTKFIVTPTATAEQYYPAFQLAVWTDKEPEEAIKIAIASPSGVGIRPS